MQPQGKLTSVDAQSYSWSHPCHRAQGTMHGTAKRCRPARQLQQHSGGRQNPLSGLLALRMSHSTRHLGISSSTGTNPNGAALSVRSGDNSAQILLVSRDMWSSVLQAAAILTQQVMLQSTSAKLLLVVKHLQICQCNLAGKPWNSTWRLLLSNSMQAHLTYIACAQTVSAHRQLRDILLRKMCACESAGLAGVVREWASSLQSCRLTWRRSLLRIPTVRISTRLRLGPLLGSLGLCSLALQLKHPPLGLCIRHRVRSASCHRAL